MGRRAHSFELNVQVLPLGVVDRRAHRRGDRRATAGDIAAFDTAIGPVIADIGLAPAAVAPGR
ncbi:hypothetical protein [Microbacterium aurum]